MKAFGTVLLILGAIVGLLFNWIAGAVLAVIGLLLIIAGSQGQKAVPSAICGTCGNPVATTANLCPTCGAKLAPTEGPLVPKPVVTAKDLAELRTRLIGWVIIVAILAVLLFVVMPYALSR